MDCNSLQIRSFKLHLTIPMNQRAHLPQILNLVFLPRINETQLEINGGKISPNRPAVLILHRVKSAKVDDESEVVFSSIERVCADNDLNFEVWICGKKTLTGIFRREMQWCPECQAIDQMMSMKVTVEMDKCVLMRERKRLSRKQYRPKLPVILEEDEEEEDDKEIGSPDCGEKKEVGVDGVVNKSLTWGVNVGILVACLGVGLFVSRASLKKLVCLNFL